MRLLQQDIFPTYKQMYYLLYSIDEEEPSAIMEVKLDEMKS